MHKEYLFPILFIFMKVAYCFSGHLRTFDKTYEKISKNILKILPGDIFIHTWDTLGNNSTKAWWSGDEKYGQKIDEKTIDELNRLYHPVKTSIEEQSKLLKHEKLLKHDFTEFNASRQGEFQNLFSMWYSIHSSNKLRLEYEKQNHIKYDIVFRMRFDILPLSIIDLNQIEDFSSLYVVRNDNSYLVNAISDLFAYSSPEIMNKYCELYNHLEEFFLIPNIGSDGGFTKYIKHCKINVKPSNLKISLLRINGEILEVPSNFSNLCEPFN